MSTEKKLDLGLLLAGLQARFPNRLDYQSPELQKDLLESGNPHKWIIRILITIGAWIAASNFVGFLALAQVFHEPESWMIGGLIFLSSSVFYTRLGIKNYLLEPLVTAFNFIGQGMFLGGLAGTVQDLTMFCSITIGLEMIVFVITKNPVQRFVATLAIPLAITGILAEANLPDLVALVIGVCLVILTAGWVNEEKLVARLGKHGSYIQPVNYGLILASGGLIFTFQLDFVQEEYLYYPFLLSGIIIGCIQYMLYRATKSFQLGKSTSWVLLMALALLTPLYAAPGILFGVLLITLAHLRGMTKVLVLGMLSLTYFTIEFYYNLETTLLLKSMLMLLSGVLLIGARFGLKLIKR